MGANHRAAVRVGENTADTAPRAPWMLQEAPLSLINSWSAASVAWVSGSNSETAPPAEHTNPYEGATILVVDDDPT